jgi:two-component system sensor histidine kinase UhpB
MQLETVDAYWARDAAAAQRVLHQAQTTARQGLQETRHALTTLRASPLEDLGLELALRQLAEGAATRAHLALTWQVPAPFPRLPPDQEQNFYRLAQEALANVVHHARARRLTVALVCHPETTELRISDDGVGFDPATAGTTGHYGLAGMRERALLLGGDLTIASQPGAGTVIALRLAGGGIRR